MMALLLLLIWINILFSPCSPDTVFLGSLTFTYDSQCIAHLTEMAIENLSNFPAIFSKSIARSCNRALHLYAPCLKIGLQKWQLNITFEKSSVISFGQLAVPNFRNSLMGVQSWNDELSIFHSSVKVLYPLLLHWCKAHQSALLLTVFHTTDVSVPLRLFTSYFRLLLESNTQVLSLESSAFYYYRAVCK